MAGGAVPGEGEGEIDAGPLRPPQPFVPSELVLGDPVAGSGCWEPEPLPLLPVAQRPPHETAFFNSQEPGFCFQILMPPLATSVALDKSLNLSGSVSASVKRCW